MTTTNLLNNLPLSGFPDRGEVLTPSGRLWPNGEFSQGFRKLPGDEPLDMRSLADSWGPEEGGGGDTPPIDLVSLVNSHTPKAQRGELGITTYGRRMLRNGVHILSESYPNHPQTLGTLTVPALQREERMELGGNWSEVVRQTIQWLTRQLGRKGLPQMVLSCSEIQPSRLETDKGAYLHLHLIWVNPPKRSEGWGIDAGALRSFWDSLLARMTGNSTLPSANIDLRYVRGNVERELSKYLSKGSTVLRGAAEDLGVENMPRTWWNMSKPLRDAIKSAIIHGVQVGCLLADWIDYDKGLAEGGLFHWVRPIYAEIGEREIQIGHTGQLIPEVNKEARSLLVSQ